jgi:hypothetical protein
MTSNIQVTSQFQNREHSINRPRFARQEERQERKQSGNKGERKGRRKPRRRGIAMWNFKRMIGYGTGQVMIAILGSPQSVV